MLFILFERFKDLDAGYQNYREHGLGDDKRVSINDGFDAPGLMALFLTIKGHDDVSGLIRE